MGFPESKTERFVKVKARFQSGCRDFSAEIDREVEFDTVQHVWVVPPECLGLKILSWKYLNK